MVVFRLFRWDSGAGPFINVGGLDLLELLTSGATIEYPVSSILPPFSLFLISDDYPYLRSFPLATK